MICLKDVNSIIIFGVRKTSDFGNLLNFLGIPSSFKDNFTQKINYLKDLVNKSVVDTSIFDLMDCYDIYVANKNIKLSDLNRKHKNLFENSITPEMLVGIDLLLLIGINQKQRDYLAKHSEYKDKFRKFIRSLLLYLNDHQKCISPEV